MNYLEKYFAGWIGPETDRKQFVRIECFCTFEPPGVHESWGNVWRLTLLPFRASIKSLTGWRTSTLDNPMWFEASTLDGVVMKAIAFLKECKEPVLRDDWKVEKKP